jgi:hypothetical protein
MLDLIRDLPAGVVGVRAHGTITADDYQQVLVPAFDAAAQASGTGKVRVLYVLGADTPDFTASAMWADAKLGLGRIGSWERIAMVTDADWIRNSVKALAWAIPGDVRVFASTAEDDARAWVTA